MTADPDGPATQLLLIEDNRVDVALLQFALQQEATWRVEMNVIEDGERAISLLLDPAGSKPDCVILDLNLPRRNGVEVLQIIRSTLGIQRLPVAVLSSSPGDVIQQRLTAAGVIADGHFTKPAQLDDFLLLGSVLRRWYESKARHAAN